MSLVDESSLLQRIADPQVSFFQLQHGRVGTRGDQARSRNEQIGLRHRSGRDGLTFRLNLTNRQRVGRRKLFAFGLRGGIDHGQRVGGNRFAFGRTRLRNNVRKVERCSVNAIKKQTVDFTTQLGARIFTAGTVAWTCFSRGRSAGRFRSRPADRQQASASVEGDRW